MAEIRSIAGIDNFYKLQFFIKLASHAGILIIIGHLSFGYFDLFQCPKKSFYILPGLFLFADTTLLFSGSFIWNSPNPRKDSFGFN